MGKKILKREDNTRKKYDLPSETIGVTGLVGSTIADSSIA